MVSGPTEMNKQEVLSMPDTLGGIPLNRALAERRSLRSFKNQALTPEQISQILWAAQGKTSDRGFRTAPSAGATFPIELLAMTQQGVFRYLPESHSLLQIDYVDRRTALSYAVMEQTFMRDAGLVVIIACITAKTSKKYGGRAMRYVILEGGTVAQNILLEATSLGLGSVLIGAFRDEAVLQLGVLPESSIPMAIIPVGVGVNKVEE